MVVGEVVAMTMALEVALEDWIEKDLKIKWNFELFLSWVFVTFEIPSTVMDISGSESDF